ncbi:carbohydrate kinase family protein [Leptobacterium flavescens]|uniref:Carbohydrate kinase family protein n=1 Tax=Leptobacterium flavescens TaxID=472055 RepID=A0A6P0UYA1_9FLAO|nr:carbohydrate kinase family protein [Leptobacterium flavescens]NER15426.1 carbohydrate kinase family protein [Leptobacterium flavescens]
MSFYKIAIAGPIPRDTIITHRDEIIRKYGCVTHPAIALSRLLDKEGEVIPISHVHQADHKEISSLFNGYGNINQNGISSENDRGTIIELKFVDQNNRLEKQLSKMQSIGPEDVKAFLDSDAFVFVPITDFEISLDTLKFIKEKSKARVIFDAHGPTTSVNEGGKRFRKYWSDKDEWLPYIDILKMNLEESQCSWYDRDYSYEEDELYDENDTSHLDDFAAYVLEKGVSFLYVTLDSRGCMVYSMEKGQLKKHFVASMKVDNVVDTTGCGDSFAGGLAYGFVRYKDPVKAAQYANILGALRTQGKTFDVFKDSKDTDALLNITYP